MYRRRKVLAALLQTHVTAHKHGWVPTSWDHKGACWEELEGVRSKGMGANRWPVSFNSHHSCLASAPAAFRREAKGLISGKTGMLVG
jgi:hypothetical protein